MNLIKKLSDRINEKYSSTATFYTFDPVGHAKFYLSALEWVLFQIEALNDEHNNGWISVDDRDNPPPYQQEVIVYLYNKTDPKKSYVKTERFVNAYPYKPTSHAFNWGIMNLNYEVLYWQLLPQPPKEITNDTTN